MVMIIIHVAYITCLVTNDGWHAYNVIGVYKMHLRAGGISYFAETAILRLDGRVMGEVGPLTCNGASKTVVGITVMGEVGAHNPGANPSGQEAKTIKKMY